MVLWRNTTAYLIMPWIFSLSRNTTLMDIKHMDILQHISKCILGLANMNNMKETQWVATLNRMKALCVNLFPIVEVVIKESMDRVIQ